ncbi:hypothetical protein ACS8Y6_12610 [Salinisphaera sp. RV14]|uniref:hypothetical protein n=1 Tax=unclassified Salinisphaera TaxID=2649847 RepID=UPI003F87B8C3
MLLNTQVRDFWPKSAGNRFLWNTSWPDSMPGTKSAMPPLLPNSDSYRRKVTDVTRKGDIDLANRDIRRRLKHAIFEAQFD